MPPLPPRPNYPPPAGKTSGQAITSLILGLLSFCVPVLLSIPALILGFMSLGSIKRSQGQITGKGLAIVGIITGFLSLVIVPCCVGPGAFGIQVFREREAERQSSNHLHQIGLAIHTYADSNAGILPTASTQPGGKGLSWRVTILPFVEEAHLYSQFHLDEPWDSPHNQSLISKMPKIYMDPRFQTMEDAKGMTYYRAFVGKGTVLGSPNPVKLITITNMNGTRNTIMVVEAGEAVPWTKPDELPFEPGQPLPKLGSPKQVDFLALFADGHIQRVPAKTDEKTLRAAIDYTNNLSFVLPEN